MAYSARSGDGLCQLLLPKSPLAGLVSNYSQAPILLIDQIAHPTCHVVLKTADEGRHAYSWTR